MNHVEGENLSALVDGELSREEMRFLLRRVDGNASLCGSWARYHVIGSALRRETSVLAGPEFVAGVMDVVCQTRTDQNGRRTRHHWLRWSAGGAIAAGVAVAALTMLQPGPGDMPAVVTQAHAPSAQIAAVPDAHDQATHQAGSAVAPRWLSAAPAAAQWAQAASADSYPGVHAGAAQARGYGTELAPYMTLPAYRAPRTREARQAMRQLWLVSPPSAHEPQPSVRIHSQ